MKEDVSFIEALTGREMFKCDKKIVMVNNETVAFQDIQGRSFLAHMKDFRQLRRIKDTLKYRGQSLPYERIAWLKIQGVPLHVLSNKVLDDIGSRFGKIIQQAQHNSGDGDLSLDYIGVLVGEGNRINEEVVLCLRGRRYRVWVMEELEDWMPEFTSDDNSRPADYKSERRSKF
ncbi:hypothetical protein Hanom_Chr10g00875991 [Helianthus anomalus]